MLQEHFDQYFTIDRVRSDADREAVFRLRYAVYCDELKYEEQDAFPDGMERDPYDVDAEFALMRYRPNGRVMGCVRVVLARQASQRPFPFETACAGHLYADKLDFVELGRERCAEISRLAVHADFRRRAGEWNSAEGVGDPVSGSGGARRFPIIPMGLFLSAAAMVDNLGVQRAFVLTEPRLARLLAGCGLIFEAIGDVVEHHGRRGPFRIDPARLADTLTPDAYAFLKALRQRLA